MDGPNKAIVPSQRSAAEIFHAGSRAGCRHIVLNIRFTTDENQILIGVVDSNRRIGPQEPVGVIDVKHQTDRPRAIIHARNELNVSVIQIEFKPINIRVGLQFPAESNRSHVGLQQIDELLCLPRRVVLTGRGFLFGRFRNQRRMGW